MTNIVDREPTTNHREHHADHSALSWVSFDPENHSDLKISIGRHLYGSNVDSQSSNLKHAGFSSAQIERIEAFCEKLKEYFDYTREGISYCCTTVDTDIGGHKTHLPIFQFRGTDSQSGSCIIMDTRNRVFGALLGETLQHDTYCAPFDAFLVENHEEHSRDIRLAQLINSALAQCSRDPAPKIERDGVSSEDVLLLTKSLLPSDAMMVDFEAVSKIIARIQDDTLNHYREEMSPLAKELFDELTLRLRGADRLRGNAPVIRTLTNIDNVTELFELMVGKHIDTSKVELTPRTKKSLGIKGQLNVYGNLEIHPLKLLEIDPESRAILFGSSETFSSVNASINEKLATRQISLEEADPWRMQARQELHKRVKGVCSTYRIQFETMHEDTMRVLCEYFEESHEEKIIVGGHNIFKNLSGHEKSRLFTIIDRTLRKDGELLRLAREYAEFRGCKTFEDFECHAEFLASEVADKRTIYENRFRKMKADGMKVNDIQRKYGFTCAFSEEAKRLALSDFVEKEKAFRALGSNFDDLERKIGPLNEAQKSISNSFKTGARAVYHYSKHKSVGIHGDMEPVEFFEFLQRVVMEPIKGERNLAQDGSCTLITFENPQELVKVVRIEMHVESEWTAGVVTVIDSRPRAKRTV